MLFSFRFLLEVIFLKENCFFSFTLNEARDNLKYNGSLRLKLLSGNDLAEFALHYYTTVVIR